MDNSTDEEILLEKQNMICEIKSAGIIVDDVIDVKKAYELIQKKYLKN